MQQGTTPPIQTHYPSHYHQYPVAPTLSASSSSSLLVAQYSSANSPQSIKSADTSVYGRHVSPSTSSKLPNISSASSRSNDVDLRRLILLNLPIDLIREYLELYLEHLSGEAEIERIEYSNLEDTTVMVTFKTDLDLTEVRRRHAGRPKLNDSEISIIEVTPPATVMIRNLPSDISRDVLELYFSNRRRSNGGQVIDVTLYDEHQHALVTFADHKDVRRVIKHEHLIHGHRLDVRIYYKHMGIEPFIDASNIDKQPDPIRYRASDDSRYLFLLKNRPLLEDLRENLKPLNANVSLQTEGSLEVVYNGTRSTVKRRLQWANDIEKFVESFLNDRLVIYKVPWNNHKIPVITCEQLADLSLKDNTRLFQLIPSENQPDNIKVTALKDHLDRALNELTDMLTVSKITTNNTIPLNDAVYRSKPFTATRDPKVNNQRSSVFLRSSPSRRSMHNPELLSSLPKTTIDDYIDNLRLYQLDLLGMRFVDLARHTYLNLSIDIDRTGRRVHLCGPPDQVAVCKNYFESVLNSLVERHYKIGKELAVFLSNPDTVELIIGNLVVADHVCAYEVERISNNYRRSSTSPTRNLHTVDTLSSNSGNYHHKLILYSLTRDTCDQVYDLIRHDVHVSSIMLDKDDKRCLAGDSWNGHVRDLYSSSGGFRRRRVLLQVKQNHLKLVGFKHDVDNMRKRINDYFVENSISYYESD
ncbi:unnamed protein product [Rotaria magnacalcarata]|uniref:RRM domain-containing protein n=8 Tax=Rotaria magnacalcarata TaxID=392030 RepID=A0A816Z3G7_9BILA|nr:unnamed protein product [Rotaria magnacalcarata]CAF1521440.1 unnamed protein product [Rotaria magnacalcarata]CAF2060501.1 unnamed protein product [Rotaria magnacalcarata]CAF2092832.1 unnamed protein product [Rotaria magnacalcarata]CAF2192218.1 unnamed protein product [Rotaria magnacalcarata]